MAKTADQRIASALVTLATVSQDAAHFVDYCLNHCRNMLDMSPLYGANYFEATHNFHATRAQIGADLALGSYPFHTDDRQQRRALRRAILLLQHVLNGTPIVANRTANKNRSIAELQEIILAEWRPKAVGESFKLLGRLFGNATRQHLEGLYNGLTPLEQTKISSVCSTGLLEGNTSAHKFKADARGAILLLRRLTKVPAPADTRTWLIGRRNTIIGDTGQQLKVRLTQLWRTYQDALPANIAMQGLLDLFTPNPLNFVETYSIHACDGVIRTTAEWTVTDMDTHPAQPKVLRMGFIPRPNNERGALEVTPIDSVHRGTDMYFLPWFSKRITKMAIPAGNVGPRIFFTAAINGCSVFITGTDQAPVVYHGGIDGDLHLEYTDHTNLVLHNAAQAKRAALFWRELLKLREGITDADILGEVNKNHYVTDTVANTMSGIRPLDRTTPNALTYEGTLHAMATIQIAKAMPWGCVFGVRHAGTHRWAFYLQENVTVYYKRRADNVTFATSRPIRLSRFFPCPHAIANVGGYVNVPNNFVQIWDGTGDLIANPYDLASHIVVNAPTPL